MKYYAFDGPTGIGIWVCKCIRNTCRYRNMRICVCMCLSICMRLFSVLCYGIDTFIIKIDLIERCCDIKSKLSVVYNY